MELVIQPDESERLQKAMPKPVPVFDVLLDDGSLIPGVAVLDDRAVGAIVGGQTGFIAFADVPELASRRVRCALRVSGAYALPGIGRWLRRRWALRIGALPGRPTWMPSI